MMSPDQKPEQRDCQTRDRHEFVAKDAVTGEAADDLADHTHRGQNHDVDRRMGVEPEQVLEQDRIAAQGWIEDSDVQAAFGRYQQNRDGDDRSSQDEDDTGGILRPHKERQSEPREAWRTHPVNRDQEIDSGKN